MPAMSPTMESGKISSWKVKRGDSFSTGDVLLTVETDKADIDVEAQDDGIVGKILKDEKADVIKVGETIALMAEEGDDLNNIDDAAAPEETSEKPAKSEKFQESGDKSASTEASTKSSSHTTSSSSTPSIPQQQESSSHSAPSHSRPLLPSVLRLLAEAGNPDISSIKGSGIRGQLTKGDVLAFLGKISTPLASAEKLKQYNEGMDKPKDANREKFGKSAAGGASGKTPTKVLNATELRAWITNGLKLHNQKPTEMREKRAISFDDVLSDYQPPKSLFSVPPPPSAGKVGNKNAWDQLLGL